MRGDIFCLIANPRTGTNHLCRVLNNFPDLRAYAEIFNRRGAFGVQSGDLNQIAKRWGLSAADHRDPRLTEFARSDPWRFIATLSEAAEAHGKRAMSFKVFHNQIAWERLRDDVALRDNVHFVLIFRRLIDSFISYRKAHQLKKWVNEDTTGFQVVLDVGQFSAWLDVQRRWYSYWLETLAAKGKPHVRLTYEADIDGPADGTLKRFSTAAKSFGVELVLPKRVRAQGLKRQDRSPSYEQKVANWPEFSDALERRGLADAAFAYAA